MSPEMGPISYASRLFHRFPQSKRILGVGRQNSFAEGRKTQVD